MNKNFNNFVSSQVSLNEEEFNEILNNLPSIIRTNNNLDFSEYNREVDSIEEYLMDKYILDEFGVYTDDIDLISKTIWIFSWSLLSLEDLNTIEVRLEDWTIGNYEELLETIKNN